MVAAPCGSTQLPDASGRVATELHATAVSELPSAIPSFLEACARLAAEALALGDGDRARELLQEASRAAALS